MSKRIMDPKRLKCQDCLAHYVGKHRCDGLMKALVTTKKSRVQDFADTIKDKPKEIIAWAKREIREYEKLIKILEAKGKP